MEEALEEFKVVARLRPSEILGSIDCAQIYFERAQNELAVETLQRALEIVPEDPLVLGTLAIYWIGVKNESNAHEYILRCRAQVRFSKAQLLQLEDAYRTAFGRAPALVPISEN